MEIQALIKLFNYIKRRLDEDYTSIFRNGNLPKTMRMTGRERDHLYFNLEPKLEQALTILILNYGRYIDHDRRMRIYILFAHDEFSYIDKAGDPNATMASSLIIRRPYHWRIKKHHYLANVGPEGYAKDAVKRIKHVVNGFRDLVQTLKCIEIEPM